MTGNPWHFALGFVLVAAVVAALVAADRAKRADKQCPDKPSNNNGGTGAVVSSSAGVAPSDGSDSAPDYLVSRTDGAALPIEWIQDGYFRTVNDTFYGAVPNAQAKPDIHANEEMLDQVRREYAHYRERISNRNNLNSYQYPNKLGWWPRQSYAGGVRLEPGQWQIRQPAL